MAYVCITGNEESPGALQDRLERVLASHPRVLCELRLDYLDLHPAAAFGFLARLRADFAPRLVLTQRLKASGPLANGHCNWDVITWQSWWKDVMALRPWFAVDLDWLILDRLAGESLGWRGTFRSRHAFFSLHAQLREVEQLLPELLASAREHNAGVKIACPVEGARDLAKLADLSMGIKDLPFRISVAMGPAGRPWRWSRLTGDLTYFSVDSLKATAAGQDPLASVLPYLSSRQRPDLYLLLGDDPENRYGEERWNRAFLQRGGKDRYINCPMKDEPGASWAENCLHWMDSAGVKGASVTRPFKLSFPEPTNTLISENGGWKRENTDGKAVESLLRTHGIEPGTPLLVAGGGGAAQALKSALSHSFPVSLWQRQGETLGTCPGGDVLISTWPGEFQADLVNKLPANRDFHLVIDALLATGEKECPLSLWAAEKGIPYLPGSLWWKEQARWQDLLWFGPGRLGATREKILDCVPRSKSETLRALAISLSCGIPAEIRGYARNEDTEFFLQAMEKTGVSVDRHEDTLRIFPPKELRAPDSALEMGEGATGFRIMAALSSQMAKGVLRLKGRGKLQERPMETLENAFGFRASAWPVEIPAGCPLPESVSLERSSQFATAFLIAAAGAIHKGRMEEYRLKLEGEVRSESYLKLTLELLREAGFAWELEGNEIRILQERRFEKLQFDLDKDASSLAFLEVMARRWRLETFFTPTRQGDGIFPLLLDKLEAGGPISLKNNPDLAPPLWSAAALMRRRLEVKECPQLHWKESDRARLLASAATALGARGEERADGFLADFRGWVPPRKILLPTEGDHRMAMAYGLLATETPGIQADRKECVAKSFPQFWEAIALLEEAMPG